jgi:hypothetical protein
MLDQAARHPGPLPASVGVTAPQVNNQAAAGPSGEARAGPLVCREDLGEAVAYRAESRVGGPMDFHVGHPGSIPGRCEQGVAGGSMWV